MGYVVAALKVLHGLDGRTHTDYGDVMAPSGGWVGRRTEARRAGRNAIPTTRRGAHKTKKNFKKEAAAGDDDDVTDSASNRTSVKIDPYINIDAGTMSPFEHGETYVLDDGGESDLDLGNYERFVDVSLTRDHNITTGKVYQVRETTGEARGTICFFVVV